MISPLCGTNSRRLLILAPGPSCGDSSQRPSLQPPTKIRHSLPRFPASPLRRGIPVGANHCLSMYSLPYSPSAQSAHFTLRADTRDSLSDIELDRRVGHAGRAPPLSLTLHPPQRTMPVHHRGRDQYPTLPRSTQSHPCPSSPSSSPPPRPLTVRRGCGQLSQILPRCHGLS
jgi:hypothetical protein